MNDDPRDLFGFVAPSQEQLTTISAWATKGLELAAEIEQAEAHLKELEKELVKIEEIELPKAMMAAGTKEFKLTNGGKITLSDIIQGGLSKEEEKREFTKQWFIDNGGQENIKDHFEIDFTKGNYSRAIALRKLLQEHQVHFDEFESIHSSTMKSFLLEKVREEKGLPPFDKMGLRYLKKAYIKKKKERASENEE